MVKAARAPPDYVSLCLHRALELRNDDVFFDIGVGNGAMLAAVHLLAPMVRLAGVEANERLLDHDSGEKNRGCKSYF